MKKVTKFAAVALTAFLAGTTASSASEETNLLERAAMTADNMRHDPAFGPARDMLDKARGILIVPSLVKGGFIFGAEGGKGVMLEKTGRGWSEPAFYTLGSASFGLQIGLEQTQVAMLIMSDKALRAFEDGDLKLGVGAGLTVVNISGGAEAATPANLAGDVIVWTGGGKGLYGGLTLNGSVITPDKDWNRDFYGKPVTVAEIFQGKVRNSAGNPIRAKLAAADK